MSVTVLTCGKWAAVYDATGLKRFEVPLAPLHRGTDVPVATILRGLGLDVEAAQPLVVNPQVTDFPEQIKV